jgi:hypothetical protein
MDSSFIASARERKPLSAFSIGNHRLVVLGFGHLDETDGIIELVFHGAVSGDGAFQPVALAHEILRGLRVIPELRRFGLRVQLVEATDGFVPVKDASSAGRAPA